MTQPTLLLSPDGSYDASGRVSPTLNGGVLTVPGQYGNAWQLSEATTNLVDNPRAGSGYNLVAYGSTTASLDGGPLAGLTTSFKNVRVDDLWTGYQIVNIFVTGGGQYTCSAYVEVSSRPDLTYIALDWFTSGGANVGTIWSPSAANHGIAAGEHGRMVVTGVAPVTAATVRVIVMTMGGAVGEVVRSTGLQLEQKPYATPYCDGSLGAGHAWTGTPHASPSTRATGEVTYLAPVGTVESVGGSAAFRFRMDSYTNTYQFIAFLGDISDGSDFIDICMQSDRTIRLESGFAYGNGNQAFTTGLLQVGVDYWAYLEWTATQARLILSTGEELVVGRTVTAASFGGRIRLGVFPGPTFHLNGRSESAVFFAEPLDAVERNTVMTQDSAWGWNLFVPYYVQPTFPAIESGLILVSTRIHESDMYGTIGAEIGARVVSANASSDIDRSDAKNSISIEAIGESVALPSASWVTVFRSFAREGQEVAVERKGTYELDEPSIVGITGGYHVANSGKDIVNRLARSPLLDTFTTPIGGFVLRDVELLIRMLGITSMGPNLVVNGDFENGLTGWNNVGTTAGVDHSTLQPPTDGSWGWHAVDGVSSFVVSFPSTHGTTSVSQRNYDVVSPAAGRYVVMGQSWGSPATCWMRVEFYKSDWTYLQAASETPKVTQTWSAWYRHMMTFDVPDGVHAMVINLLSQRGAAAGTVVYAGWDDIRLNKITGDLLPESVLAFPSNSAVASSRIQHLTSDTRLEAVNDRLKSIGMMAVNATPDSKFTSRRMRDVYSDEPVRRYDIGSDARLIGEVRKERSVTNQYNRVFAIKEGYDDDPTLVAVAENTNPNDPWNIYQRTLAPKIVPSQDAVDMAALQAIADTELARASVRDTVSLRIIEDLTLSVYDIIEITGDPSHPAVGKWAIESMESDLMANDAATSITARRTKEEFSE